MKKRTRLILGIIFTLFLVACSNGSDDAASDGDSGYGEDYSSADIAEEAVESEQAEDESEAENLIGEKVIRTAEIEYETLDFQETTHSIMETVSNHGAYVEYSSESSYTPSGNFSAGESGQQYRVIDYTFRVPTDSLSAFLEDLEGSEAYKVREQIGSEDVTQSYRDLEARIGVLQNKEDRLNTLLEQAESIEDILQIENNLSETIAERESLQSRLDEYDDLVDFSTVHLTVTERPRISNVRGESLSFFERAREALVNSFFAFYYFVQDVLIWLIYAAPYLLVLALILFIVLFIRKRTKNKK